MRKLILPLIGDCSKVVVAGMLSIKKTYGMIRRKIRKVTRTVLGEKTVICSNPAPPRTVFITWLALGKLRT